MVIKSLQSSTRKSSNHKFKTILISIVLGILGLIMLLYLSRNLIIKTAVEMEVRKALGMKVSITELKFDFFPGKLEINGLTVYNPPGFQGETLTKIPKIIAEFEPFSLLSDKFHFRNLELNLNEITIVKNQNKELNLNRIRAIASVNSGPPKSKPQNQPVSIQMDQFTLTVDHVKYVDYSKGRYRERRIWLGIYREKFTNLHSIDDIVRVVIVRVVLKSGLNNIGLPFRNLSTGIQHVGKSIQTEVGKTSTSVRKLFRKVNFFRKK